MNQSDLRQIEIRLSEESPYRRVAFHPTITPTGGRWRSDAVVAVRRGQGQTIYPAAINLGKSEAASGQVTLRPRHLDPFRGLAPRLIGWADRPDIGWRGGIKPTADRSNWDRDGVSPACIAAPPPDLDPEAEEAAAARRLIPDPLRAALAAGWGADTSADGSAWPALNPPHGQCAVTALVIQDRLGGQLLRTTVGGVSHYYNQLPNGVEVDMTWPQFPAGSVRAPSEERTREYVLSSPATTERYRILARRVANQLAVTGDPLACRYCGHRIEAHHPSEYGHDVCVGLGYRKPYGVICLCDGFVIRQWT